MILFHEVIRLPVNVIDHMSRIFRDKLGKTEKAIEEMKRAGKLNIEVLTNYSRLLKMKEWLDSKTGLRYFAMEGARLLLAEKLDIKDGDKVLDVGAGDGWFSIQAALVYSNAEFFGVELSEEFAEAMEYAKIFELKNVFFFYFDAYDLPFPDKVFDKIALFFALANIGFTKEDLVDLFTKLNRVLKQGGLLGIAEPFIEDFPGNMGIILRELYNMCFKKEETILSQENVKSALLDTGFKIIDISKIKLRNTGVSTRNAKKYLENYYRTKIPVEIINELKNDKVWVRDDPPQYTIIIAQKYSLAQYTLE